MEEEKSKEKDLNYPLKLWLLSLFVTSVSLYCVQLADGGWHFFSENFFTPIIELFLFSMIGSLPTAAFVWCTYRVIIQLTHKALLVKIVAAILSIAGVYITFYSIFGTNIKINLPHFYTFGIILSALLFYVKQSRARKMI